MTLVKYILDTNTITHAIETRSPFHVLVNSHLSLMKADAELYISILSLYEIEYGIALATREEVKQILTSLKFLALEYFPVLPLPEEGARIFGGLKAAYFNNSGISKEALKRHNLDFMLASIAIAEEAVLVSSDVIFETVKTLHEYFMLENWTKS